MQGRARKKQHTAAVSRKQVTPKADRQTKIAALIRVPFKRPFDAFVGEVERDPSGGGGGKQQRESGGVE